MIKLRSENSAKKTVNTSNEMILIYYFNKEKLKAMTTVACVCGGGGGFFTYIGTSDIASSSFMTGC